MTNRPKSIGTAVETAVVREVLARGWPAQRTALAGAGDLGDVHAAHGAMVIECKGGKAAESASWRQLADWWAETEREATRVVACDLAVLVVKRKGSGQAKDWRAFVRVDELVWATHNVEINSPRVVEMPFGGLLSELAAAGWAQ